jgi:hypothetical protein
MITAGLITEAFLFLMLGILPPEKDYYWEKLYPGLDDYNSNIPSITAGESSSKPLNGEIVEQQLGGMLSELQGMSKSLGSLKALQEVDFSKTKKQIESMGDYYSKMNAAMEELGNTAEDTKKYRENLSSLNKNLGSLNSVYGNMLSAMSIKS